MRAGIWVALTIAWLGHAAFALAQEGEPPADELAPAEGAPEEGAPEETPPEEAPPEEAENEEAENEEAERAPAEPPRTPWRWPGVVIEELTFRLNIPPQTDFDRALIAHRYGNTTLAPMVTFGLSLPIGVEWLWLGGRAGVRGRTWDHAYVEDASLVGVDLLVVLRARFLLGQIIELGAMVGGGLGWMGVWMNGAMMDQFIPRFDVAAELAFRIGNHFALGPRVGWDYFQWGGVNSFGHGIDAGGFYFALSLEGRE